jgi:Flp pilus assembly protein TadD
MAKPQVKSKRPQPVQPPSAGAPKVTLICLGLVGLVVWTFWPSVSNGFVNLDDPLYVYENAHVLAGLTWQGIGWAFTTLDGGLWHPLTWLSLMLDCQIFGLRAGYHHLTSLLLHAATTLLVFLTFRRMTSATWRSVAIAVLFGLHPLHVESVAWVADRKDVLGALFWMLALLAYVIYVEQSKARDKESAASIRFHSSPYYLLSLFFFVCGLMSKTTVLTLPAILLLLDWWPLGRFRVSTLRHLFLEKVPFLAAGALAASIGIYGQKQLGAVPDVVQFPIGDRIANAALSFMCYLVQTFWPVDLAAYYPYPATFPLRPVFFATLLILIASALLLWAARRRPYLAVGWLWYVVTLLPVIGLVQVGGHSRADRYTYVPLIGLFLLVTWAAHDFTKRWRYQAVMLSSATVIVTSVCLVLTRRQIGYWKDGETLFRHAIAVTRDNPMAQMNLGVALTRKGQLDEAVGHLQEAVRLAPNHAQAHNNLGVALGRQRRLDEAIVQLQEAIRIFPNLADAHANLGDALSVKGDFDEAITQYQQAIQLNPNYADTHNHLGIALTSKGRLDEAIDQFQQALNLNPNYSQAHAALGVALGRRGRLDEAISHLQEAVRLKPDAAVQNNLRAVLALKAGSPKQSGP